jgi:PqqD family protein of HPr-rel-A system
MDRGTDVHEWHPIAPSGWIWAQWEENYSLFHVETGDTHMLSEIAAFVLQAVSDEPLDTVSLCEMTADMCDVKADEHWLKRICALVGVLEELELIERGPA